jgi:hypothetical protein
MLPSECSAPAFFEILAVAGYSSRFTPLGMLSACRFTCVSSGFL